MIAPIDDSSDDLFHLDLTALGDRERWMDTLRQIDEAENDETWTVTMSWRNAKIITRPSTARAWIEGALDRSRLMK
jgi:hypothetical protein